MKLPGAPTSWSVMYGIKNIAVVMPMLLTAFTPIWLAAFITFIHIFICAAYTFCRENFNVSPRRRITL
jgi:hypothetical protein